MTEFLKRSFLVLEQPLGRWCTRTSNKYCDPMLKGSLADVDNNLCLGKPIKQIVHIKPNINKEEVTPWTHPTPLVYLYSYGI